MIGDRTDFECEAPARKASSTAVLEFLGAVKVEQRENGVDNCPDLAPRRRHASSASGKPARPASSC